MSGARFQGLHSFPGHLQGHQVRVTRRSDLEEGLVVFPGFGRIAQLLVDSPNPNVEFEPVFLDLPEADTGLSFAIFHIRSTLSYMKTAAITIRLDESLEELLDQVCKESGRSRSEVVRDALRRQLAVQLFNEARRKVLPFAEARGILTDEDIYKLVS